MGNEFEGKIINFKGARDDAMKRRCIKLVQATLDKEYPGLQYEKMDIYIKEEEHKVYYLVGDIAGTVDL